MNDAALHSDRLRALLHRLEHPLLERALAARLLLLAALAGEHVLLIGPPGTAKSALARRLHHAFADVGYLERLLTRFSTPEELFGPLSLKALDDDRYERLVDGFLPTVGIAFLDEVFKANSAILNALLTLLNEREFDNGTQRLACPLISVVGATNDLPNDDSLQAFYDRFLVRLPVATVSDAGFTELLNLQDTDAPPAQTQPLRAEEVQTLRRRASAVCLGDDFLQGCQRLRGWLQQGQHAVSDRRWRQFVQLARVAACSEGRHQVDALDLWLAPYVLLAQPDAIPELQTLLLDEILQAPPLAAPWLERAVQAFEQQLKIEEQTPAEGQAGHDDSAGKAALARSIGMSGGLAGEEPASGPTRLVSARLEERQRKRWGAVHVRARLAQLDQLMGELQVHHQQLLGTQSALAQALLPRLWCPPDWVATFLGRFEQAADQLALALARLASARQGFADLPVDEGPAADASAPPAVSWVATA